jgi:hypothetical protein
MDIGDLLAPKGVVLRSGASSKRQALHALARRRRMRWASTKPASLTP